MFSSMILKLFAPIFLKYLQNSNIFSQSAIGKPTR
jgi:hypothetical protein